MSDSTRLGRARGKMLPVAFVAAALVALLAFAPFASAAPDPIKSGTTTLTINSGFNKQAKKAGIKITAVKPSKIKGTKATFAVTGGSVEPTTGAGTVNHSGGLKITWGKKSATLKSLTVDTTKKSISAKVGGKTIKIASLAGTSTARLGFGASVSAKKVKLTSAGANALNKALTPAPKKTKVKKNGKTIVKTVKVKPPFKANLVIGASITEVEPETVAVLPTGTMTFAGATTLLGKLAAADVKLEVIPPTTATAPTTFVSSLSGGTISPLGTSGQVNSSGGLKLVQTESLPGIGQPSVGTTITLGSIGVDLAAKTATVEVIGESNFKEPGTTKEPLKLGNLGRSSIADLAITATPSPATRTLTVSATGTIQPVATEALNGFIKIHQVKKTEELTKPEAEAAAKEAFEKEGKVLTEDEAKAQGQKRAEAKAAAEAKALEIVSGEPLGSFSFVATGE